MPKEKNLARQKQRCQFGNSKKIPMSWKMSGEGNSKKSAVQKKPPEGGFFMKKLKFKRLQPHLANFWDED